MIPVIYNLRSLAVRRVASVATAFAIAMVVLILGATMMLAEGMRRTLGRSGSPDGAIVLRKGADAELSSTIEQQDVALVLARPGVAVDSGGAPIGLGELVAVATMEKIGTAGGISNVSLRGIPPRALQLRPDVRIVEGRAMRPGTDEVMVGARVRGRFKGLDVGQSFELRKNRPVTVVGVFEDGGSSFESEVWIDIETLRSAFARQNQVSSIRVRLSSASAFAAFESDVEHDKRLGLEVMTENEFYEKQSEMVAKLVSLIGFIIAFCFGVGAILCAMITMHASIADRQREIGTLRALGFSRLSVLGAFLLEALLLAGVGGALGLLLALAVGRVKFSIINFQSWSEIVFSFVATPNILVGSYVAALIAGLLGGVWPAVRAARTPPSASMRG
jgi:putative ABC transport system permease protein